MVSNLKTGPFLIIIIVFFLLATFAIVKFSYLQENRNLDKRSNAVIWLVESGSQSLFAVAHRFIFFKFNFNEPTTIIDEDKLVTEQIASSTDENISLPENNISNNLTSDSLVSDDSVNNQQSEQSLEKINLTDNACFSEYLNHSSAADGTENLESKKVSWENWNIISIFRINWRCLWQDYWQRQAGWLNN